MTKTEQKEPQEKAVQMTVPVPLWDRVKKQAKAERRLVSQQATVLMERGLAATEAQEVGKEEAV